MRPNPVPANQGGLYNTNGMDLTIEIDREEDGRWIADIPQLPGVMVYGETRAEARLKVKALALRVIADLIENGDSPDLAESLSFKLAA